jgi:hypothetical protein
LLLFLRAPPEFLCEALELRDVLLECVITARSRLTSPRACRGYTIVFPTVRFGVSGLEHVGHCQQEELVEQGTRKEVFHVLLIILVSQAVQEVPVSPREHGCDLGERPLLIVRDHGTINKVAGFECLGK